MLKVKFFRETDFIDRIKANDRTVLGELFLRYQRMVFSYITSHGGSEADAEDMLQEAIIVLWQKVCAPQKSGDDGFKLTSKLGTYIMAIAKNKWMAELRKRKRYTADGNLTLPGVDSRGEPVDEAPSSLDCLLAEEKSQAVHNALQAINPNCKKLLLLFYFEERSMKDIAKQLGFANMDVAKSKKHQCKKSLEAALKKQIAEIEGSV